MDKVPTGRVKKWYVRIEKFKHCKVSMRRAIRHSLLKGKYRD